MTEPVKNVLSDEAIEKQIRLLEVMIPQNSEIAYLLDISNNYEISYTHHGLIVSVIDKIRALKRMLPSKYTFDARQDSILG